MASLQPSFCIAEQPRSSLPIIQIVILKMRKSLDVRNLLCLLSYLWKVVVQINSILITEKLCGEGDTDPI